MIENNLKEKAEKFHSIYDSIHEGVSLNRLLLDEHGHGSDYIIIDVNRAYEKIFQKQKDIIINRTAAEVYNITPVLCISEFSSSVISGMPVSLKTFFSFIEKHFLISVFPCGENEFITIFHDITDYSEIEDKCVHDGDTLKDTCKRLKLATKTGKVGLWNWDLITNKVYYSTEWKNQIGYKDDEITNDFNEWESRVHPEDLSKAKEKVFNFIENPYQGYNNEFRFRHKNGYYRWILAQADLSYNEQGQAIRMSGSHVDITEQKQTEQSLKKEKEILKKILDNIPVMIIFIDSNGNCLLVNKCWEKTLGWSEEEAMKINIFSEAYPDPEYRKYVMNFINTSANVWGDFKTRIKNGNILDTSWTNVKLSDGSSIGIGIDITENKKREYEKTLLYNTIGASLNEIYIFDSHTLKFQYVNSGALKNLNYSLEEIQQLTPLDIKPDFDKKTFSNLIEPLIKREKNIQIFETVHRRSDNNLYPVEVHLQLFPHGSEKIFLAVIKDITARKKHEKAIKDSEERYRLLFEINPHPMWIYDLNTLEFLEVNHSAIIHYGYSREEFLLMTIKDIRPPEDISRLMENINHVSDGLDIAGVWRHCKKNGDIIFVEITSHVINWEGRKAEMVLSYDVTERKRAEEEKEKLQAQLIQAQKMESIGRLAGGVAHDFNNMLGIISGYSELIMMDLEPSNLIYSQLQHILDTTQKAADLTRQLLAFARKQPVKPKILNLNETISGMIKMLRRLIGEDIELIWIPDNNLWTVKIDPVQIDQILANLVINSRDAISGTGSITLETGNTTFDEAYTSCHVEFLPGEYVLLAVSDTGTGMTKEVIENLFEPFFTTKELGKGTGLGLCTVYGIVKQNNGFINVYSEPEKGTTIKIYLPRFKSETLSDISDKITDAPRHGTETILIAEDEEEYLGFCKILLKKLGYTVLTAKSPKEAIKVIQNYREKVHLLITDVVMPDMNGRELLEQIKTIKPDIKCLYMSGYTANIITHRGVLDEGINFIQKPFSIKTISQRVRAVLDGNSTY